MERESRDVPIYGAKDFEGMRKAGAVAAAALDMIEEHVKAGVTTEYLDDLLEAFMRDNGTIPATLGYRGYTKSSCISINHVVCHGIPSAKKLKNGDILNIDVTAILDGWHGDTSRMYFVGDKISIKAKKLVDITYKSMMAGIDVVKPGATLGDIGFAIQEIAEANRFSVVRDFCGHGLGQVFHQAPTILHYGKKGEGMVLKEGMFFTIEPMINIGKYSVKILSDGWTAVTRDRSLSAQFEHSIGVTATGCEIFTKSPLGYTQPPYK